MHFFKKIIFLCLAVFFVSGCSTFKKDSDAANYYLRQGDFDKACDILKVQSEKENDDQLVYLLDYSVCLHYAEKYDESIRALLKAQRIAEIKDYTSLSREAGSILLNEGMVQYKGDDFEKVFIHIYLALNFMMKNDLDGALVEARRVNEILVKFRNEGKRPYNQNHLAFYMSAVLWEAEKNWDSAYIAYNDAYKLMGSSDALKRELIRTSRLAQRLDDYERWSKKFKVEDVFPSKAEGELVFFYQQGQGPRKGANPSFISIPSLYPVRTQGEKAKIDIYGKTLKTTSIYSITEVATQTLNDQYAPLIAKRVAGKVAKYAVADQVSKKNEPLGAITWIGLNLIDQADLRQWSNLPDTFQVARIFLVPGDYRVVVEALDANNIPTGEKKEFYPVKISANKKTFLTWRSFK